MKKDMLLLGEKNLTLQDICDVALDFRKVGLSDIARKNMTDSYDFVNQELEKNEALYGINTGFGALSSVKISQSQILELQKNLIRSHSVGVGGVFKKSETRAITLLRAHTLSYGHSGIRPLVVEKLIEFLNQDLYPQIFVQGSVGASGDLAPLSHLALNLIGEGEMFDAQGVKRDASEILKEKNIEPLCLDRKEGLALINGCQVMTAQGLLSLARLQNMSKWLDVAGALSVEALQGSRHAFDSLISQVRPHRGEIQTAQNMRNLLTPSSEISENHKNCEKVQDAYSLRCIPAVHGAFKVALQRALETLEIEANSSTDNPLVFAKEKKILSCGNFHGEPVAFCLDYMALSLTGTMSMSERRTEKLITSHHEDLPFFLTKTKGLHSGFMMLQVTAASLVSENKILSHPASIDTIPTSAGKEDHVSMGTIASRKLFQIINNSQIILAIELLSACQALDFLRPLKTSPCLEKVYSLLREKVSFAPEDRVFYKDIEKARELIDSSRDLEFFQELET